MPLAVSMYGDRGGSREGGRSTDLRRIGLTVYAGMSNGLADDNKEERRSAAHGFTQHPTENQ